MRSGFVTIALSVALAAAAHAADDIVRTLDQQATAAYKAKDYAGFLEASRALQEAIPWSLRARYNLACGYALTGASAAALRTLEGIAAREVAMDLGADDDLASLRALPAFKALQERMKSFAVPVGEAAVAFMLPETDLIPEGVAYDPKTGAFFVTSVRHRKVVRRAADGSVKDFTAGAQDGLLSAVAPAVDAARRALWVSSSGSERMVGGKKEDEGRSFLAEYDIDTGRLRRKVEPPAGAGVSDIALLASGDVVASDPRAGGVYLLDAKAGTWRTLVAPGAIRSPQGLAPAADGKSVYVADYARGVARVTIAEGSLRWLDTPQDLATTGVDGLSLAEGFLIAVQNGVEPHRVVAWGLDPAGDRVVSSRTLVRNHAAFDEPTLGTVVGPDFLFVANSQYRHFRRDGTLDAAALKAPVVLRTALPR
jgi:sugar lactone lactonase YvrE